MSLEKVPQFSLQQIRVLQMMVIAAVYARGSILDRFLRSLGMPIQYGQYRRLCGARKLRRNVSNLGF